MKNKKITIIEAFDNKLQVKEYIKKNYIQRDKIKAKKEDIEKYYKEKIEPIKWQYADIKIEDLYQNLIGLLSEILEGKWNDIQNRITTSIIINNWYAWRNQNQHRKTNKNHKNNKISGGIKRW